jgi:hypothetical protein
MTEGLPEPAPRPAAVEPVAPRSPDNGAVAHEENPAENLPAIDDLTADSDIKSFLKADVPQALRAAALRKAWSLDPNIRDFVGLSENAWDFNDPASIPGFGPTASPVATLLAQIGRPAEPDEAQPASPPAAAVSEADAMSEAHAAADAKQEAEIAEPAVVAAAAPDERPAGPHGAAKSRRHGGAISLDRSALRKDNSRSRE